MNKGKIRTAIGGVLLIGIIAVFVVRLIFYGTIDIEDVDLLDDNTLILKFSDEITLDDTTNSCFSIKDEQGNNMPINLILKDDNKTIRIDIDKNVKGYDLGGNYTLTVSTGINGEHYSDISDNFEYIFTIKEKKMEHILGLGEYLTDSVSNNREYEWYIDQGITGEHEENNSGTVCSIMAAKWYSQENGTSVTKARNSIKPSGELWTTENVKIFLQNNNVKNIVNEFKDVDNMKKELKNGKILILYIDSSMISYCNDYTAHIGRFYSYEGPHYIIVKGYKEVDGILYFEVYDPYNFSKRYSDNSPKGRDRYYVSYEIIKAMENQWNYYFVISDNN